MASRTARAAVLIVACLATVLALQTRVRAAPTVYFEPAVSEVEQGQAFSIGIRIDAGVDTLTCFLVEFVFDPTVVELISADEGTLFAQSGHGTMFDWDTYSPGHHSCNDVTLGYDSFVMCPGELVHLVFLAVDEGETALSLNTVDLRDIRRDPILPVFTGAGVVTVGPATGIEDGSSEMTAPLLRCSPNPFSESVLLEIEQGSEPAGTEVMVYDISGRVVSSLVLEQNGSGSIASRWFGTDVDGDPLPGGVYFVVASGPSGRVRDRITLVR